MRQLVRYTGRTFYTPKPLDISRVIDDLRKELRAAVPPNIALHFELCDHLPLIGAGLIEIQQVLHNLVTNAVDAIGEGPGRISVTTKSYELSEEMNVALYDDQDISAGRYVEVVVADTGCGMTPDIAAKAFDPFFTTKFLGRGLGLAEVQGVLRAHRGAVRVESSPSTGSKFILLFPAPAIGIGGHRSISPMSRGCHPVDFDLDQAFGGRFAETACGRCGPGRRGRSVQPFDRTR